jgi:hypothetical protein
VKIMNKVMKRIVIPVIIAMLTVGIATATPPSVTNPTATPPSIVADGVQTSQLNVTATDPSGR